jgi:ribonuclease Z
MTLGIFAQACERNEENPSAASPAEESETESRSHDAADTAGDAETEPVKKAPVGRVQGAKVVLLGSGGPPPEPLRSGPAVAVLSQDRAYLVDFGPGVVRRAMEAYLAGWLKLRPDQLTRAFVTHLHSDHTAGYADLILTPPSAGRDEPLRVYGPPGITQMTDHLLLAYEQDLATRRKEASEDKLAGYQVESYEIEPGVVYEDEVVRVSAFRVEHGDWKNAYGYRFDADGRSIVISGDTAPSDAVVEACSGCDVLVHEVYCEADFKNVSDVGRSYFSSHHTSTLELAEIAKRAEPKLLVLNHLMLRRCNGATLLRELKRASYEGAVVVGEDLAAY